jgi:hypothetical protein
VDAFGFRPYANPPARVIDVYSIGRRLDGIHRTLLDFAARRNLVYFDDTLQNTDDSQVSDHREHRDMYANTAEQSGFSMVAPGKVYVPEHRRGRIALGVRYFEGAAACAVLFGHTPDCEAFRRQFDWPQAVIGVQPDDSDAVAVISRLSAEPKRLQEIS